MIKNWIILLSLSVSLFACAKKKKDDSGISYWGTPEQLADAKFYITAFDEELGEKFVQISGASAVLQ